MNKQITSKPWAVVINPGMDTEYVMEQRYATFREAKIQADVAVQMRMGRTDVMKELADGTLTTDF